MWRRAVAVLVAAAASAGCADSTVTPRAESSPARESTITAAAGGVLGPQVVTTRSGLRILVAGPADGGDEAVVSGTLVAAGRCLSLDTGDSTFLVLWPSGSGVDREKNAITTPGGQSFTIGDVVEGGGGYFEDELPERAPAPPSACLETAGMVTLDE